MTLTDRSTFTAKGRAPLAAVLAALPLCAALAAPAAAASFFTFEVKATFSGVSIGSETINQEFVLSGQTTPTAPFGWDGSPVEVAVDMDSLSLTYGGSPIGATDFSLYTYEVLEGDYPPNNPALWRFNESSGVIDFRPVTALDGVVFKMQFDSIDTWVGFGGSANVGDKGPGGEGGRRFGITTTLTDTDDNLGVIDFGDGKILQSLRGQDTTRSASYTPIPLPAAGWLLLGGIGGLALLGRRRKAQTG